MVYQLSSMVYQLSSMGGMGDLTARKKAKKAKNTEIGLHFTRIWPRLCIQIRLGEFFFTTPSFVEKGRN